MEPSNAFGFTGWQRVERDRAFQDAQPRPHPCFQVGSSFKVNPVVSANTTNIRENPHQVCGRQASHLADYNLVRDNGISR